VDKFLGLQEDGDGDTELPMGAASRMENFLVTDSYNLTVRPGIRRLDFTQARRPAPILASWSGHIGDRTLFVLCDFAEGTDRLFVYAMDPAPPSVGNGLARSSSDPSPTPVGNGLARSLRGGMFTLLSQQSSALGLTAAENAMVKIFDFGGDLYVMSRGKTAVYREGGFQAAEPYIPLVITGAAPAGGGTALENINLLSNLRRIGYSADGTAAAYVLPPEAEAVTALTVDNVSFPPSEKGFFDAQSHTFTFQAAPVKGVGNVEFTYSTDAAQAEENRLKIVSCPLVESYNGATDTRLFAAGNGSNLCYYSGVTQDGTPTALYFPAMNQVAVDLSGSPITGLVRHYGKLLVFKPDGTFSISYEPVTLADGSVVAGFYLRNMNREVGNAVMGQVQTVNNYPRTVTKDGIYEWRITSSYYKDERYAQRISDPVRQSLAQADVKRIVTCDDDYSKTYYVFLNDLQGTVLVNRYGLGKRGVWCLYRSTLCRNVRQAMMYGGRMVFVNETEAFWFDENATMDAAAVPGEDSQRIGAVWESGFMHFGADFRRKYSSILYVSVLPQSSSEIIITAETDKRTDYMEKTLSRKVFQWSSANFPDWTFSTNDSPQISRIRLKVKKFVYYKLIFRVERDGGRGTILGFDQQVRFASMAK